MHQRHGTHKIFIRFDTIIFCLINEDFTSASFKWTIGRILHSFHDQFTIFFVGEKSTFNSRGHTFYFLFVCSIQQFDHVDAIHINLLVGFVCFNSIQYFFFLFICLLLFRLNTFSYTNNRDRWTNQTNKMNRNEWMNYKMHVTVWKCDENK